MKTNRSTLALVLLATVIFGGCTADRPDLAATDREVGFGPGATVGPCAPEGSVAPCHQEIGRHGDVVTCIDGEKFCFGGAWSQCLQKSAAGARSVKAPLGGGGLSTLTLAPASSTCVDMPCDPYCQDSTVPGPFSGGGGGGGTVVGVSGGFLAASNLPGTCSSRNGGATAYSCSGFKAKTTDPDGVCSSCSARGVALDGTVITSQCQSACQSDQHCTGDATDSCTAFAAGEKSWCTGIDVTVPVACLDSLGRETLSVCNRGTVDLTSPVECCQFPGNAAHFSSDLSNGAACAGGTLLGVTLGTIAAGTCQAITIIPTGNTSSIICNPHYTVGATSTTTPATYASTPSGSSGGWTSLQSTYGAGDTSALLGRQTATQTFDSSYANGSPGFAGITNAQGTSADASYMTAAVAVPAGTTGAYKLPTTNAAATAAGWTAPNGAMSDTDGNSVASNAAGTQTVTAGSQSTTSGTGAGAIAWLNAANATGPSDAAVAESWPGKSSSSTMTLAGYGALPAVTSLTVTARLRDRTATDRCTVTIDLVDNTGANVLGGAHLYNATIASTTAVDETYTLSAGNLTTVNASATFLADPRVMITITSPSGNPSENRVYVDSVKVVYGFAPVQSYGTFSFGVPSGATVTSIDWTARLRNTAPVAGSYLKVQGFTGTTPIGAAKTFTTSSVPALTNALAVQSWSDTGLSLTPAELADGTFTARVDGGGGGTAELEYLKARVTYVSGATNTITLKRFAFAIPSGATVTSVVTSASWKTDRATGTLGIQPFADLGAGTVALGTETTAAGATIAAAATNTFSGAITPAQLNGGTLEVHLRASGTTTSFNASVDYVAVTVTYQLTSATADLGNFGFSVPTGSTMTSLSLSLREKVSSAAPTTTIAAEAFRGSVSTGAVAQDTSPSTGYSTVTTSGTSLGSAADYADGSFVVRLTATTPVTTTSSYSAFADYVTATLAYTTAGAARGVTECNDDNNWTAYKRGNSCVSQTTGGSYTSNVLTYEYPSSCAVGFRPQWGYLVWDGQTPSAGGSQSSITFEAQTQWLMPTVGAASAFAAVAGTAAPFSEPPVCPFTGVTGCPIDLVTALGKNARADKLTIKITLKPSCDLTASPCTGTVSPTLSSWHVTYGCVDAE